MKAKGYSLWLIPEGENYQKLKNLISYLSKKYQTPNFIPHVTLIGEVVGSQRAILDKTRQLVTSMKLFKIKLTKVDYFDEYFRCLFVKVRETKAIMKANSKAREIFKRQKDPKYLPHLSLMYGNFPRKIKEEIIKKIGREFNLNFSAETLYLYSTNGEVKDFYRVKEYKLR